MVVKSGVLKGRTVIKALVMGGLLLTIGAANSAAEGVSVENWPELRDETFAVVWETVNESYYDPTFGGVDWPAIREKYRGWLSSTPDKAALRSLLQSMLGELQRTHFAIMPRETAVFTPAERIRIGTTGAEVAFVENVVAVSAVKPDSAAARAGIHPGDTILQIDELDMKRLEEYLLQAGFDRARSGFLLTQLAGGRLRGAVGVGIRLTVGCVDGSIKQTELVCEENTGQWSEAMGNFPSMPVECTVREEETGIFYLHFNVFARPVMKEIKALLLSLPADGGLVLDLRGNPGGISVMAPGICGWLSDRSFLIGTMQLRQGQIGFSVAPQEGAFLGPVALLVDGGSASTSEIMAAGLQEAGRARIFGERSAGAALPSLFRALPAGDLLQYAVADIQTPNGKMIEGRGVSPDEPVSPTLADLAAGRDPVIDRAKAWLRVNRHPPTSSSLADLR